MIVDFVFLNIRLTPRPTLTYTRFPYTALFRFISPALGLGFVVAPLALAARFGEVAGHLNPAPNATTQFALTEFLAEGHFLRHLRYMKTLYRQRRELLQRHLDPAVAIDRFAGLTAIALLPYGPRSEEHTSEL